MEQDPSVLNGSSKDESSLGAPADSVPVQTYPAEAIVSNGTNSSFSSLRFNRRALLVTASMGTIIAVALIGGLTFFLTSNNKNNSGNSSSAYSSTNRPLSSVRGLYKLPVTTAQTLAVNGVLQVNKALVIAPTNAPSAPVVGEIYYNSATNTPYYYNGSTFVSFSPTPTTVGGASGAILLGNGLTVNNNQLAVSNSLLQSVANGLASKASITQGQTGASNFTAGNYIQAGTAVQSANFNVQSAASSSVTATLQANNGGTADILDLKNGASATVASFGYSGNTLIQTSINSTTAFQVQNASGYSILTVSTNGNGNITIGSASSPATISFVGGSTSLRPASPTKGELYYDTSTNQLIQYNGTKWVSAPRTATEIVAASNSTQAEKDAADYVTTGTSDDTTINAALSALPTGGGTVYLEEGTYYLSNSISIPNNTTLSGSGSSTIITVPNNQNGSYDLVTNSDKTTGTNVNIENLLVDGNKANQTAGGNTGIDLFEGSGTTRPGGNINGVTVQNINGFGIYVNGYNNVITDDTVIDNSSVGIYSDASQSSIITSNNAQSNGRAGIFDESGSNNTITNNTVEGNNTTSSDIGGLGLDSIYEDNVSGNMVEGNTGDGIGCEGAGINDTFNGNTLESNSSNGIIVCGYGNNNTITGNTSQGNGGSGIYLEDFYDTISGNNIEGNGGSGIYSNFSEHNTITGNEIDNSGGATANEGIFIGNSSTQNSITDNNITDTSCSTTCYAIDINDAGSTGNYLSGNHFTGDGTHNATINDATTSSNTYSGQQLTVSGDAVFRNGTNSTSAFQVQNASGTAVLSVDTTKQILTERNGNSFSTIGSELMASNTNFSSGWSGTNWSNTGSGATHASGNTATDVYSGFTPVVGTTYQIVFAFTGATNNGSNGITPEIGGTEGQKLYDSSATSETQVLTAYSSGSLEFVPTSGWTGTITSVSVMTVSVSNPSIVLQDSSGNTALEIRPSDYVDTFIGVYSGSSYNGSAFGDNVGLGSYSLQDLTDGYSNDAIGTYALQSTTTGVENVAVGDAALGFNTTGNFNVALGAYTLLNNITGVGNTAVGVDSGGGTIFTENTANSYDTFLGDEAGSINANLLQNSTAIGAFSAVTQSNSLVLGCVNGVNSCTATTEVGIGTTAPAATLDVRGNTQIVASSTSAFSAQNTSSYSILSVDTTGNGNITVGNASNPSTITFVGGSTSLRPATPTKGQLYYDTSTNELVQYNGTKWSSASKTATEIVAASNSSQAEKDAADYVATGTGDQATINAAFSALPAGGGAVYLMEGTYYLSSSINIPDNTTLTGSGPSTIITIPNAQNGAYNMITNSDTTTGTNVNIENLTIDGNKANQTAGNMNGISLSGVMGSGKTIQGAKVTGLTVRNLYAGGTTADCGPNGGVGLYLCATSYNDTFTNNFFEGDSYGMYAQGYGYSHYTGNTFNNNSADGIFFYFETDDTITNNTAIGNTKSGFNGDGLYNSTFTGNVADTNGGVGINFPDYGEYNTITGNTTEANTGYGIYLQNYASTVSSNTVYANAAGGIEVGSFSGGLDIITANKIDSNGGATANNGIYVDASSPKNSITDNDITDSSCTSTCYAIDISSSTSTGNYISGNHFTGDGTYDATIYDATTSGDTYSGQQLTQTGDAYFRNNTNSTTAFEIQNATGTNVFSVDTSDSRVGIGTGTNTPGNLLSVGALTTAAGTYQIAVSTNGTSNSGIVVQDVASQSSGYAFTLQSSSGTSLASIDYQGNLSVQNATITGVLTVNGHIVTTNASGTTTAAVQANAGTSATCSVTGDDTDGTVTLVTGTASWASGAQCIVSFGSNFIAAPNTVMSPTSSTNGMSVVPTVIPSTSGFTVNFINADTAQHTYTWDYVNLH